MLRYYDSTKPLVNQGDASQRGVGAALLQANGPITFASKSLTETESRYSYIEREMLGIVFGVNIKYVPGSDVKLADALSRVNPCNTGPIRAPICARSTHASEREPNSYGGNSYGNIERQHTACAM